MQKQTSVGFLCTIVGMVMALGIPLSAHAVIGGKPVREGTFKQVLDLTGNGGSCTAIIVGPRALLTAAQCIRADGKATVQIDGVSYSIEFDRHPAYPAHDADLALGVSEVLFPTSPATLGGTLEAGMPLLVLGYGSTHPQGGASDHLLRKGTTTAIALQDQYVASKGGAVLGFGDSGGPAFVKQDGELFLVGIASKGNILDTNWHYRLDTKEARDFLSETAERRKLDLCGINVKCPKMQTRQAR